MNPSHPAVHPVEAPPTDVHHAPRVRMKDYQGMPGTLGGLALRLGQFCFAVVAFSIMLSTDDFSTVTAFCYLVAATVLQCLWSLALAVIDGYALLVKRSLRNSLVVSLFVVGDGVTATLTFAAACASAGITVLIGNDLRECDQNHCGKYETATAMAFLSWFMVSPSFLLTFWLLASR
uniref:CASP-like protein 5A1 n=1 Tax=Ginkgo biloba TaxID=3311 RepID=CSPL2_GINBI|nr:RecName: Full=CASP-like protein 5A1; Short=GbCASPL5A1 [Ginkgo biloba]|eukprot:Gb_18251 [translate_table: standard]